MILFIIIQGEDIQVDIHLGHPEDILEDIQEDIQVRHPYGHPDGVRAGHPYGHPALECVGLLK